MYVLYITFVFFICCFLLFYLHLYSCMCVLCSMLCQYFFATILLFYLQLRRCMFFLQCVVLLLFAAICYFLFTLLTFFNILFFVVVFFYFFFILKFIVFLLWISSGLKQFLCFIVDRIAYSRLVGCIIYVYQHFRELWHLNFKDKYEYKATL
jgi:hypothetical protein